MTITIRNYKTPEDFTLIGDFLIRNYQPDNRDGNWLQPTWEYMHSHPSLDKSALDKIGVWEDAGEIVGVVHYESNLGEVFFEIHPDYVHLRPEMLDYAEKHLYRTTENGQRYVQAFVNDYDAAFEARVQARGYNKVADRDRPMSRFVIPTPFPEIKLPAGFRLKSLEEDNDLTKTHRVLWRGFDHAGEPPDEGIEARSKMQSVPYFRKDLNIVVEAPSGNFVSYSGQWYDPINQLAYVEPVATDPDFRRLGLGKAAVLTGVRRCGELGATVAFVGSDQEFYTALGFRKIHTSCCWMKYIDL